MSPRNPLRRGTQGALTADELTARHGEDGERLFARVADALRRYGH